MQLFKPYELSHCFLKTSQIAKTLINTQLTKKISLLLFPMVMSICKNQRCNCWLKCHFLFHVGHYSMFLLSLTLNTERKKKSFNGLHFFQSSTSSQFYLSTFYRHHVTMSFPSTILILSTLTVLLPKSVSPVIYSDYCDYLNIKVKPNHCFIKSSWG